VAFCDRVERTALTKRRAGRGAAGARLRLIGQGWPVGVRDGAADGEPAVGPVQGAGLSPWLGPVSLHAGRDRWCETEVQPRRGGKAPLSRSGDDCLIGFARADEARRGLAVLGKRFGRCGLIRPPDQTRRRPCGRAPQEQHRGTGLATCACLGFTCSGARSRQGRWGRWGARPGGRASDGPRRPSTTGVGATGTSRGRRRPPRSVNAGGAPPPPAASAGMCGGGCAASQPRSEPGIHGGAVAASASGCTGRGLWICSSSALVPARGWWSGSGA
jgi:hypothetical protein